MNLRKPTSAVRDATALRPIREQNEMSPVGKNGCGGGSTGTALSRTRRRPAVGSTIPSVRWGAITSSNHVSWKESGRALPPVGIAEILEPPRMRQRPFGIGSDLARWRIHDAAIKRASYRTPRPALCRASIPKTKNTASPQMAADEAARRNTQFPTAPDLATAREPLAAKPPA